jgi:ribosomal protein S5
MSGRKVGRKGESVEFDSANVIGLLKSTIGMCVDEEPHAAIRKNLWRAVEMLYELRLREQGREKSGTEGSIVSERGKQRRAD